MAIIPWKRNYSWDPFKEMEDMTRVMNKIFNCSIIDWPEDHSNTRWAPAIDVYDEKDKLVVRAEIPGIDKKDIEISVENKHLIIKGERKKEEKNYVRKEMFYGTFQRVIPAPFEIDEKKMRASYKNGVLEVILPKKERSKEKQRKIEIE